MIIFMQAPTTGQVQRVLEKIQQAALESQVWQTGGRTVITAIGEKDETVAEAFERLDGVEKVVQTRTPFKLASRSFQAADSIIRVGPVAFGGAKVPVIAGPCAVESYEQFAETARLVKAAGASMLRGGAYKPRTSPYSFQGLEEEGLRILRAVADEVALPVVSEVTDPRSVEVVCRYVDMLQIGTRNMQNFALLKEVAKADKPVLLKRGSSATVEEWLMAAEYIMVGGNDAIVLCERGIRTFEPYTRNTLDLSAVPLVKHLSHLPVIADPSHGTGKWRLVTPMTLAAVAGGADGVIVEVHPCPEEAVSDGFQSLTPQNFEQLMQQLAAIAAVVGREA